MMPRVRIRVGIGPRSEAMVEGHGMCLSFDMGGMGPAGLVALCKNCLTSGVFDSRHFE